MRQESFCRYNKFGYCKFGNKCYRRHEDRLCEKEHCEVQTCHYRHPRRCRFFFRYNYCKFGTYCKFKHQASDNKNTLKEIEDLKIALEKVNKEIIEKEEEIKRKDDQIISLEEKNKNLDGENLELKNKVQELRQCLENANNTVAENTMLHLDFKERVQEKYGYDSNDSESDYESDEEIRINNRIRFRLKKVEELRKMVKCDICDYTTKSEVGLKTHKTKKHKGT